MRWPLSLLIFPLLLGAQVAHPHPDTARDERERPEVSAQRARVGVRRVGLGAARDDLSEIFEREQAPTPHSLRRPILPVH